MAARDGDGPLSSAISRSLELEIPGRPGMIPDQCLGWIRFAAGGEPEVFHHEGGTHGSCSTLYLSPEAGTAVVVLSNQGLSVRKMIRIARSRPMKIFDQLTDALSKATAAGG